jgi:hypothetical protein
MVDSRPKVMNRLLQYIKGLPPVARGALAIASVFFGVPLLLIFSAALILTVVFGSLFLANYFFPVYSAELNIRERDATVAVSLYRIESHTEPQIKDSDESGRYLTVHTSKGSLTQMMCGYDWAHNARTGVYLVGDKDIAVVGVDECDYLITLDPLKISRAKNLPSDSWVYLGAFDWVIRVVGARPGRSQWGNIPFFRFISVNEQPECISGSPSASTVRNSARKHRCPSMPTEPDPND